MNILQNSNSMSTIWSSHPIPSVHIIWQNAGGTLVRKLHTCWQTYQHIHTLGQMDWRRRNSRQIGHLLWDNTEIHWFESTNRWIKSQSSSFFHLLTFEYLNNCSFILFYLLLGLSLYFNWFISLTHEWFIVLLTLCALQCTRKCRIMGDTLQFGVVMKHKEEYFPVPP